eukprot:gene12127-8348_t
MKAKGFNDCWAGLFSIYMNMGLTLSYFHKKMFERFLQGDEMERAIELLAIRMNDDTRRMPCAQHTPTGATLVFALDSVTLSLVGYRSDNFAASSEGGEHPRPAPPMERRGSVVVLPSSRLFFPLPFLFRYCIYFHQMDHHTIVVIIIIIIIYLLNLFLICAYSACCNL